MKTYLIFFGKSQAFTFHAFDSQDYISEFSNVIKDFELLESDVFNIDDIKNKEIIAKYNFKSKQGTAYSLIKLYSFAQALSSERIAGSIFGVALLSDTDLTISTQNIDLLRSAKKTFAELSMNGLKFNKSDFKEDVIKIWKAVINSEVGNYFNKLTYSGIPIVTSNNIAEGFWVKSLFEDPIELNDKILNSSRIYFSEDLEHLKRSKLKWPNNFIVNQKVGNQYIPYKETVITLPQSQLNEIRKDSLDTENLIFKPNTSQDKIYQLESEISSKNYEIAKLKNQHGLESIKLTKKIYRIIAISVILFLSASIWIWTLKSAAKETQLKTASDNKKKGNEISQLTKAVNGSIYKDNLILFLDAMHKLNNSKVKETGIDISIITADYYRLGNELKLDSILCHNFLKLEEKKSEPKSQQKKEDKKAEDNKKKVAKK